MVPTPALTTRTSAELRRAFLEFFRERDHVIVPSAPLVPNDPTLLFTTAGMVQFKPYYTAGNDVPYTRAASIQKCLRLTDLDRVGITPRHDTFFEMLGNFSFGPREKGAYFKEEAIAWAWEFVTRVLGLPRERLYASIFAGEGNLPRDDEAAALWKRVGLPADRIVALGREDNFWGPAGGQGPCGPCSEIYFDLGERPPADLPPGTFWGERPGDPGDRFMEFWNLVLPQFDAKPDGALEPLPRPGIDTGMGLERLALIMQDKRSIFETDLFMPIVEHVLGLSRANAQDATARRDARIVADHVRGLTFAIAEGALPGNEGAGYVLRRLLRRAVTRGRSRRGLAIQDQPLLAPSARIVCERYGDHYAELLSRRDAIERVLEQEEAAFVQTYEAGLTRLEQVMESPSRTISGADAFALHDTYGFPIELTEEIAAERGVSVDRAGFEQAMDEQRRRAREGSKFKRGEEGARQPWTTVSSGTESEFIGYGALDAQGLTLRRWRHRGDDLELVLDRTPAYAESGGQVADRGSVVAGPSKAELVDVYREADAIVHRVRLTSGDQQAFLREAAAGRLEVRVDASARRPTMRHHTATHLLHAALREVLGSHVRQAGSLVAPDRLRFDYTHFEAPSREQLARIEAMVSEWILRNEPVSWQVMPLDAARSLGAMALFGEKYGAEVRVVTAEGVAGEGIPTSRELCGGTHVTRTGDIGAFVVVSEASIASGVRRIEALCGHEALAWLKGHSEALHGVAAMLQTSTGTVREQIEKLRQRVGDLEAELVRLASGSLEKELDAMVDQAAVSRTSNARWFVGPLTSSGNAETLREAADRTMGVLGRGAFVVALNSGGKLTFMASVSPDLVAEKVLNASDLVRKVAQVAGGSGGGKPHLALAGGKDAAKLEDALDEARRLLAETLGA